MLAVQFLGNSKVEVKEMPTPSLKPGEVLLKIVVVKWVRSAHHHRKLHLKPFLIPVTNSLARL
jgi:NADPH:quinone reductase-like Zn-dependent oxidoreductase